MRLNLFIFLVVLVLKLQAQNNCEQGFVTDTLYNEKEKTFSAGSALITPELSNKSQIAIFKVGNRYFMKITLKDNLYFDKIDDLELVSGSKSWTLRSIKQYQKDKFTSFFVFEVYKNYINTLKDDGLTSFIFNKKENKLSKQDTKEVKKIASCFYKTINVENTKK